MNINECRISVLQGDHTLHKNVCVLVICHVVGITYQTIEHRLLAEMLGDPLGNIHTHTPLSLLCLKSPTHYNYLSLSLCLSDTQVKVWMNKYGWVEDDDGRIFIYNQEESVKPKNIVEKIDFDSETLHSSLAPFIPYSVFTAPLIDLLVFGPVSHLFMFTFTT